ncbi:unnamed protein product, partial [Meganyctiphanes norvegica]
MFDSSESEEEGNDVPSMQVLKVDWLDMSFMGCPHNIAISGLPGCRFRGVQHNLNVDLDKIQQLGISDTIVLVTRGEMRKYRVPSLLSEYQARGIMVHHYPFLDGTAPSMDIVMDVLETTRRLLEDSRRILLHCMGGLGRACVMASCILQYHNNALTPDQSIFLLRELRGAAAVQTVKQYNFIQDFRTLLEDH